MSGLDLRMLSLLSKTLDNYELQLVNNLVTTGKFSAACSSKTLMSDKKGKALDVYRKGIAVGIMKYNSFANELIFLRIVKELVSVLKLKGLSGRQSSTTRKAIKSRRSKLSGRTSKKSKGGALGESPNPSSLSPVFDSVQNVGRLNPSDGNRTSKGRLSPTRKSSLPITYNKFTGIIRTFKSSHKKTGNRTSKVDSGPNRGMIAKLFALVCGLLIIFVIAMSTFSGAAVEMPKSTMRSAFMPPPPINTIVRVEAPASFFENAPKWLSGEEDCGTWDWKTRSQSGIDMSIQSSRGKYGNACMNGKSPLKDQMDGFERTFIPYANSLIMAQQESCKEAFEYGFESYIRTSDIWNAGERIHVQKTDEMVDIGLKHQRDVISNMCGEFGSFGIKKDSAGRNELHITMVDPSVQDHYITEFDHLLNTLSSNRHITDEANREFKDIIKEFTKLPNLPAKITSSLKTINVDTTPLGDKFNMLSQVLVDYNTKVDTWAGDHKGMVSDYKSWKSLKGRTTKDEILRIREDVGISNDLHSIELERQEQNIRQSTESGLNYIYAPISAVISRTVGFGVKIITNAAEIIIPSGIGSLAGSAFKLIENVGIRMSPVALAVLIIYMILRTMVAKNMLPAMPRLGLTAGPRAQAPG